MKTIVTLVILALFSELSVIFPFPVQAQPGGSCGFTLRCDDPVDCKIGGSSTDVVSGTNGVMFEFHLSEVPDSVWASLPSDIFTKGLISYPDSQTFCENITHMGKSKTSDIRDPRTKGSDLGCPMLNEGAHEFFLTYQDSNDVTHELCKGTYNVVPRLSGKVDVVSSPPGLQDVDSPWQVTISNVVIDKENPNDGKPETTYYGYYNTYLSFPDGTEDWLNDNYTGYYLQSRGDLGWFNNDKTAASVSFVLTPFSPPGDYTVSIRVDPTGDVIASKTFTVLPKGAPTPTGTPPPSPTPTVPAMCSDINLCLGRCGGSCNICPACQGPEPTAPPVPETEPLCNQLTGESQAKCEECRTEGHGIWTAVGCIPADIKSVVERKVFPIGIGIAGGIAFLYFLYGSFIVLTSGGNPEMIAGGKQVILSALSGLFLIIFSIFVLRVIGVDILNLPGFS